MKATNVMEIVIREAMQDIKDKLPLPCKCDQCLEDVLSLTLNHYPAHYASTNEGINFIKAKFSNRQDSVQLMSDIIKSCQIVSNSPSHVV